MGRTLREVRDEDLPLLFEQWADPVAVHMAAFTARDHMDWGAFERRWSRVRADETALARVIVVDDDVAGTIGSWGGSGERELTYWIGRCGSTSSPRGPTGREVSAPRADVLELGWEGCVPSHPRRRANGLSVRGR